MPEFQAVVMAGGVGWRMFPLTERLPKAMLPIANRPLLSYPLELLEKVGFTEALLVTNEASQHAISQWLRSEYRGTLTVDVHTFKPSGDVTPGTADALYAIRDHLKSNFLVVSCDLIVDASFVHHMADLHRARDALCTMLVAPAKAPSAPQLRKSTAAPENTNDVVVVDEQSSRVLFLSAAADQEDSLNIPASLLRKYPAVTLCSNVMDAHFYFFKRSEVLDVLHARKKKISSIKADLLPHLIQQQVHFKGASGPADFAQSLQYSSAAKDRSGAVLSYHLPAESPSCLRVNTLSAYIEANRAVVAGAGTGSYAPVEPPSKDGKSFVSASAQLSAKTQLGAGCVVGDHTKIGDKCTLRQSVIGRNCVIGDNAKITSCVLMDDVVVGANAVLTSSVVCSRARLGDAACVTNSQVGVNFSVPANAVLKGEQVTMDE